MKFEMPLQNLKPEQPSDQNRHNIEFMSRLDNIEPTITKGAERYEQKSENSAIISDVNHTTILPTPVNDNQLVDGITTTKDSPMIAADDDLIEKEWVEKAKRIITETRDNPHQREEKVNKLQIDYLVKRYGKKLDVTE